MQSTINTRTIAKKLLEQNILNDPGFSFTELCKIRDALMILARFGLADMDLLWEVNRYISEKVGG